MALIESIARLHDEMTRWRRDIHANPELGEQEVRTAKLVADHLKSLGLEVRTGVAKTGVTLVLKNAADDPTLLPKARGLET